MALWSSHSMQQGALKTKGYWNENAGMKDGFKTLIDVYIDH